MRLPTESQLSKEQKEVCFAPTRQSILVTGPPGSGKTVVAVFRHKSLDKQGNKVKTLVFTNVLKRYTDIDATFQFWLESLWRRCTSQRFPKVRDGRQTLWDYESAQRDVREEYGGRFKEHGHWGHLILDEAQDFSPSAHGLLYLIQNKIFGKLEDSQRPQITILADENQRLHNTNSTIDEIKDAYLISGQQLYTLKQNYRNTKEISALAAHFYAGLQTGIPEPPTRRGDIPKLIITSNLDEAVKKISNYMMLHENEEVGVLVHYNNTRKKLFNKISNKLNKENITVQTYSSQDKNNNDASALEFDTAGRVTVLCFASAKGLEFDAVFLPELQTFDPSSRGMREAKMTLYVMISRARERLFLMMTDPERTEPIWSLLPQNSEVLEIEET